jgi:NADP-dependent 3-hydroxy acid dehydrogenase YdfG
VDILQGKVAVVTGASQGIGRAIAGRLANAGATVCLIGRNRQKLESAAEPLPSKGAKTFLVEANLAGDEGINEVVRFLDQHELQVDILIHSAGEYTRGGMEIARISDFDMMYQINVRGAYLLTQALLPSLKSRHGEIVFINSSQGQQAAGGVGQYAATQHALKAIAESVRDEVNQHGVRVLSIFCGRTATPRMEKIFAAEKRPYNPDVLLQPEDIAAVVFDALALSRTAEVTNITIRPMIKSY